MRFQKGNKLAGSRKGVPNKTTADLKQMVLNALEKVGGEEYLIELAKTNQGVFAMLVGKCLPREVTGKDGKDLLPPQLPEKVVLEFVSGAPLRQG